MNFDFEAGNFLAGLAVGWASAYGVYRSRHLISEARDNLTQQASTNQESAQQNANRRYVRDLVRYCEGAHLAGKFVPLSDVLVEPRFIPMSQIATVQDEEDVVNEVFHVVPNVPDHPYLQAPYNIETLSIQELDNGERSIALLGLPGSGRTTALQAIALWSLGRVKFEPPKDIVQEQLEAEESQLTDDERAQRLRDWLQAQEMLQQGVDDDDDKPKQTTPFQQLLPVYVHLADVVLSTNEFGRRIDPAEPLLRAVQQHVRSITRKTFPRPLYTALNAGEVLLLLDGLDDLPPAEQKAKLQWLTALREQYRQNFIIVAGSAVGYGDLMRAGYSPVFLRPWNDVQINTLTEKWAQVWPRIAKRGTEPPGETRIQQAREGSRARPAFEVTLKTWNAYADADNTRFTDWIETLLAYHLPNKPLEEIMPQLQAAAVVQLTKGHITASLLEQTTTVPAQASAPSKPAAEASAELEPEPIDDPTGFLEDDAFDRLILEESELSSDEAADEPEPADEEAAEATTPETRELNRLISTLYRAGLLVRHRGNRYRFRHSSIAASLASMTLADLPEAELSLIAERPEWRQAMTYTPLHRPVDSLVQDKLAAQTDILHSNLTEMARWLAYTDGKTDWQASVLSRLGNLLVAPDQFALVRERVAAALISTRSQNALRIFQKAIGHPNPDVRRLSCLGIGALGVENAAGRVADMMADQNTDVQIAAGMALGAIYTEEALRDMVMALENGNDKLRQAVAETFALIPDTGYPTLYDAVSHENMMVRRAAVFGLRRINTPWALIALYQTSIEDEQFYVKAAAESAFYDLEFGDRAEGVKRYPAVENIPWVKHWMMNMPEDELQQINNPEELLLQTMQSRDYELHRLTVTNIGQLGLTDQIDLLYETLRHPKSAVREAAVRSLGELALRVGQPLPAPN